MYIFIESAVASSSFMHYLDNWRVLLINVISIELVSEICV